MENVILTAHKEEKMKKALVALALTAVGCANYVNVRAGLSAPVSAQEEVLDPSATVGAAYGMKTGNVRVDIGADYHESHSEQPPATIDTKTLTPAVTVSRTFPTRGRAKPYVSGELVDVIEFPHVTIGPPFNVDEDKDPVHTFGLGIGGGVEFEFANGSSIEARLMYRRLIGSENVEGIITGSVGFNF
jgi:hypothetical protein